MPRVFLPEIPGDAGEIHIEGETARYLVSVLRLRAGDGFEITDGSGKIFSATFLRAARGRVTAGIGQGRRAPADPPVNIVLVAGVLKGRKMDLVLQKVTELGVSEIMPVITERTLVRETRKAARWRKIALEAARQCGRTAPPVVHEPRGFNDCISSLGDSVGYIFWEEGGSPPGSMIVPAQGGRAVAAVGPEGGFTSGEVAFAGEAGLKTISLGPRTLRAETASITAVALLQFLCGGLSG